MYDIDCVFDIIIIMSFSDCTLQLPFITSTDESLPSYLDKVCINFNNASIPDNVVW